MSELSDLSAERFWLLFFRHFDREHGMALVKDLWRLNAGKNKVGAEVGSPTS